MEPHELAIAALSQVARNANHREQEDSRVNEDVENLEGTEQKTIANDSLPAQCGSEQEAREDNGTTAENSSSKADALPIQDKKDEAESQPPQNSSSADQVEQTDYPTPSTAGQKRTVDGNVKSESPSSPVNSQARRHSRNISTVSNTSTASSTKIGELTSELRTRLSYAMIKVKKGWQSNSIDEVECLASQKGTSTPSSSTFPGRQNPLASPRAAVANMHGPPNDNLKEPADAEMFCRSDMSNTYESFWRDHSAAETPNHRLSSYGPARASPPSRALEPSADIQSASSQSQCPQQTPKKYLNPQIRPNNQSSNLGPHTPRGGGPQESSGMKPPTKTTVQEQDAIETLLFMSSPGNMAASMGPPLPHPRSQLSPQGSPLRTEINLQPRGSGRAGFDSMNGQQNRGGRHGTRQRQSTMPPDHEPNETVDRFLDDMGESSSDEDELVLEYDSPHRMGRI